MKRAFWILMALLIVSIAINFWQWRNQPESVTLIEHDTVWNETVIRDPLPAETINTGRVAYIKVPVPGERDTITLHDSIEVHVPIVQKMYDDSLYTAWVSGYDPSLDSITLHMPHTYTTITKTVTKPASRFAFGPSVGVGYGMIQHKADIYVGVTATYNLWK